MTIHSSKVKPKPKISRKIRKAMDKEMERKFNPITVPHLLKILSPNFNNPISPSP